MEEQIEMAIVSVWRYYAR